MAARLHADWIAVHVDTPRDQRLSRTERENILRALELAEQLGGRTVTLSGQSVADEILAYAREHNVNRIVVGKPERPAWRERLRGSLLDTLVRRSEAIEVLAISGEEEAEQPRDAPAQRPVRWRDYAGAAAVVLIPTGFGLRSRHRHAGPTIDAAMLYLLAVVVAAARFGRARRSGPPCSGSPCSTSSSFLRSTPFGLGRTLPAHLLCHAGGGAGPRSLDREDQGSGRAAREREQRTAALYALSRALASARQRDEVLAAAIRSVQDTFAVKATVFLPGPEGGVEGGLPTPYALDERERAVAQWSHDHGQVAGQGTRTLPAARAMYLPLAASDRVPVCSGSRPAMPDSSANPPGDGWSRRSRPRRLPRSSGSR